MVSLVWNCLSKFFFYVVVDVDYFCYELLWLVRGIFIIMGRFIKEKIINDVRKVKCYGLMVDDVIDI